MSSGSVASDSFSSARSGTTSPDRDSHASSLNYSHTSNQWERSQFGATSLSPTSILETLPETLSNEEILQIESFYRGLFSQVYVCPAVASFYLCELENGKKPGWVLHYTEGVPVIIQATRPDKKSVHIIFAERGTGFPLWRDTLNAASSYRSVDVDYHDFQTSSSPKTKAGLRIFSGAAASKFLQHVVSLVSNPTNYQDAKGKRTATPKRKKNPPPKKTSISPPCCFAHLAHISKDDELTSLSQFVINPPPTANNLNRNLNPRTSVILPGKLAAGTLKRP